MTPWEIEKFSIGLLRKETPTDNTDPDYTTIAALRALLPATSVYTSPPGNITLDNDDRVETPYPFILQIELVSAMEELGGRDGHTTTITYAIFAEKEEEAENIYEYIYALIHRRQYPGITWPLITRTRKQRNADIGDAVITFEVEYRAYRNVR